MAPGGLHDSPALAFEADADDRVVDANAAAAARWPIGSLAADGFPEDARARYRDARGRGHDRFEWGEHGPGGVRAWFVAAVSPREGGGSVCVSTEITELKRAEQRLALSERLMVDTQGVAHLGTWDWDIT